MSKPKSGLFHNTPGAMGTARSAEAIIAGRTRGLDLREHPRSQPTLSASQRKAISNKIIARTATKEEYKRWRSDQRFTERRKDGVTEFWMQERRRIKSGALTTREWTPQQINDLLHGRRPKHNGKTIQGHHTYSASRFPHLANLGVTIYPATFEEHLYEWHGGNYRKSSPGRRVKKE